MYKPCGDLVFKFNKISCLKNIIHLETNANYSIQKLYYKEYINSIFIKYMNMFKNQKEQFAFMILIKKYGSVDKDNWDNIPNSTEKCPKMYKPEQGGDTKNSHNGLLLTISIKIN